MEMARGRLELWGVAGELIIQYPMWGVGPDGFRHRLVERRPDELSRDAHNYWLQLAAENGLPAAILLIALLTRLVYLAASAAVAAGREADRAGGAIALGAVAGPLMLSFFSHPLLLPELLAYFGFWLALGAAGWATAGGTSDAGGPNVVDEDREQGRAERSREHREDQDHRE
jgi:O-antigen ligase